MFVSFSSDLALYWHDLLTTHDNMMHAKVVCQATDFSTVYSSTNLFSFNIKVSILYSSLVFFNIILYDMIGCKWSEAVSRSNTAQYCLSR